VVQAMNRIDLTVSVEACRPPDSARAERTRMVGAIAVRSAVTCGWMSWASAIAAGDKYPACITAERPADIPPGGTGIVGSPLVPGTAGMTGVGVAGTLGTGSGAAVAGARGIAGTVGAGATGTGVIGTGVIGTRTGAGITGAGTIGAGATGTGTGTGAV